MRDSLVAMRNGQSVACRQVELTELIGDLEDLGGYQTVRIFPRLHGWSLPPFELPAFNGLIKAVETYNGIIETALGDALAIQLARWVEIRGAIGWPEPSELFAVSGGCADASKVSVVVCTRDRAIELRRCLESLRQLDPKPLEIIIVDNAPSGGSTESMVRNAFPEFLYVKEPRPGLDWARNAGIHAASGEILAFTDDDVTVDPRWAAALSDAFGTDPNVMVVTGLVQPAELETEAQQMFEYIGGFGRGYYPVWTRVPSEVSKRWVCYGAGRYGTGANMAFRRRVFDQLGGFDPALDVGTTTNGGGDLEMFARVLSSGDVLCYWPRAIVLHYHRRQRMDLYHQLENNGRGFVAYIAALLQRIPSERPALLRLFRWWMLHWVLWPSCRWAIRRGDYRDQLRLRELKGALSHPLSYRGAKRRAREIAGEFGGEPCLPGQKDLTSRPAARYPDGVALREIDVMQPLVPISDVADYEMIDILVRKGDVVMGSLQFEHNGRVISTAELSFRLHSKFKLSLFESDTRNALQHSYSQMHADFISRLRVATRCGRTQADIELVSVVIATLDRPDQLHQCLMSLVGLDSKVRFEIIVVDNNPESGLTLAVAQHFANVRYVTEIRRGLSYARNAGIREAHGDVIAFTDDDVIVAPGWLEKLRGAFYDEQVAAVTGNILPASLESASERQFERYGGLGRGYTRRIFDYRWLNASPHPAPTWEIGATANAAFRAMVFSDSRIGLLDEALGAGTPTGCSEDTYLFYRILRAGYRIVYEPSAYVWHKHRGTEAALRRQIFAYSKGHVAYLLTTWSRDGDRRAFRRLLLTLPFWHARNLLTALKAFSRLQKPAYPAALTTLEILGNLLGPFALVRSRIRVKRLGRSSGGVAKGVSLLTQ